MDLSVLALLGSAVWAVGGRLFLGTERDVVLRDVVARAVIGLFIWVRIDDQRQRFCDGLPRAGRPAFRITKTSEAACVQDAVSEWPSAARCRFRGGYHGA